MNDSSISIESIRLIQRCSLILNSMNEDVLDTPQYSVEVRFAEGKPAQSIGAEPGGRWLMGFFQNSERPEYVGECAPRPEFILFGDGSYEGKESEARLLKTKRDGVFASVIEWLEIINREDAHRVDLIGLAELARKRVDDDRRKALK